MQQMIENIWYDESGQDLAEYAILLALIAIIIMSTVQIFGVSLRDMWLSIQGDMEAL